MDQHCRVIVKTNLVRYRITAVHRLLEIFRSATLQSKRILPCLCLTTDALAARQFRIRLVVINLIAVAFFFHSLLLDVLESLSLGIN